MPKIIQMPRRTQPENENLPMHRSMTLPEVFEESESLSTLHRWLEIADTALQDESTLDKKHPA